MKLTLKNLNQRNEDVEYVSQLHVIYMVDTHAAVEFSVTVNVTLCSVRRYSGACY